MNGTSPLDLPNNDPPNDDVPSGNALDDAASANATNDTGADNVSGDEEHTGPPLPEPEPVPDMETESIPGHEENTATSSGFEDPTGLGDDESAQPPGPDAALRDIGVARPTDGPAPLP